MFSRQAGCGSGCDGVVSVRGKSSNFGRGSTDVDIHLLVFPFDCNLMFVCPVDVPLYVGVCNDGDAAGCNTTRLSPGG